MPRFAVGLAIAFALTAALTLTIAWPVVVSPTQTIFGDEIVGRHYDAYAVMLQMASNGTSGPYAQPVTDRLGWLLAHVLSPVAAYNVLVLLTFPLTGVATYALSRYVFGSHAGALVGAAAFTFAPFHLAHAAYHPHIAQTQWVPLYFLALFAFIDRPHTWRAAALALAAAALVLSNDYAGFIGAVMTPVALVAYWSTSPSAARRWRHLWLSIGLLTGLAGAGLAALAIAAPQVFARPELFAFQISDLTRYNARWWAYVTPPVDHAVLGGMASQVLARHGVTLGLVEQQVSLSYGLLVLAAVAAGVAVWRWRAEPQMRTVPALLVIALVAAVVSIGPGERLCGSGSWAPACLLYPVAPMFRSYARFAVVVHLAAALAGAAGATWLARRSRLGLGAAVLLVGLVGFEYWPLPWRAHDVLPTRGHRWLAERAPQQHTLDCVVVDAAQAFVPWLMQRHLSFLMSPIDTCFDPDLGTKLAALGYTHVLVRRDAQASPLAADPPPGLALLARFPDSRVYFVTAEIPPVVTLWAPGFWGYERAGDDWWRWMGQAASWEVRNTTSVTRSVRLSLSLTSLGEPRTVVASLDGGPAHALAVGLSRQKYELGPWALAPGDHRLTFAALGAPVRPSDSGHSSDERLLTVALRGGRWILDQ